MTEWLDGRTEAASRCPSASLDGHAVWTSRALTLVCWLVLMSACGSLVAPSPSGLSTPAPSPAASAIVVPTGPVTVMLGLYSGRPDPEWTLTVEEVATLDRLLAALPQSTGTPATGGLGYHGFTIVLPGRALIAYGGAVAAPGQGARSFLGDPTRSVEHYLLEISRAHVLAIEYAETERAIAGP